MSSRHETLIRALDRLSDETMRSAELLAGTPLQYHEPETSAEVGEWIHC